MSKSECICGCHYDFREAEIISTCPTHGLEVQSVLAERDAAREELTAVCAACGRETKTLPKKDGAPKLPKGWRALAAGATCRDCAAKAYYVRAFRVEIRGLSEGEEREPKEFLAALSAASRAAARFGNWYVQRLFAADLACGPALEKSKDGKTKLPRCPQVDYYREAVAAFPELSGGGISGLAQMVCGWYSAGRFDAFIALNRSVENYRFGYLPVEVRKQDWSLSTDSNGNMAIRVSVNPGKSWRTKIYADRMNLARLRALQTGSAIPLGMKIVRASKQPIAGGDGKPRKAWFYRISAMFPRATARRQSHQEITLTLGHDAGCLLFGTLEGSDDVFEFPGLEVRKMIVGGDKSDRAWQKENSIKRGIWSKRKIARWSLDRSRRCERRARKIAAQLKLAAAGLARWCVSHAVTSVDYEITDRGFVPHFPWRKLRDDVSFALQREGIALHIIVGEETNQEESGALVELGSETNGRL